VNVTPTRKQKTARELIVRWTLDVGRWKFPLERHTGSEARDRLHKNKFPMTDIRVESSQIWPVAVRGRAG
jgi:hypothetical protein